VNATMLAPARPVRSAQPAKSMPVKVVVLGGRAVGSTRVELSDAFVGAVSELPTEPTILPYGRCAVSNRVSVHVYGMPAQQRYWFMWDALASGAVAALILADATRLADCFAALDYAAERGLPYLVAVTNAARYGAAEVRDALSVPAEVPVLLVDEFAEAARPARDVLHTLVRHAVNRRNWTLVTAASATRAAC